MRAYSIDLRERIVRAVESGRPQREVARLFGVAVSTVQRYLRQQATGSLQPRPIPGGRRRIDQEQEGALRAQLAAHPDATLREHGEWWEQSPGPRVSLATMSRAMQRLRWTRKKRRSVPASGMRRSVRAGGRW